MSISLTRSTPVLRAGDYERARAFYRDLMGFEVVEEGGTPPRFGIFRRGAAFLFVNAWNGAPAPQSGGWDAYIHLENQADYLAEIRGRGVMLTREPEETVYGMREFEIRDPDGNVLCFGEDVD